MKNDFDSRLSGSNQSFPSASEMWSSWWVEHPLDAFLGEAISQVMLVSLLQTGAKFFFASDKVGTVVAIAN